MNEDPTQNLPQDGLQLILARLDSIDARLTTLEDKVDRRLQETRPIWEQVLVRLDGIEQRLDGVEKRLDGVEKRLDGVEKRLDGVEKRLDGVEKRLDGFETELHTSLRRFERQVGLLAKDVMEARADQFDLDRRMDQLEPKPTQ